MSMMRRGRASVFKTCLVAGIVLCMALPSKAGTASSGWEEDSEEQQASQHPAVRPPVAAPPPERTAPASPETSGAESKALEGFLKEDAGLGAGTALMPMPAPVLKPKARLEGKVETHGLSGSAEDGSLQGMNPKMGSVDESGLRGRATEDDTALRAQDPDLADRELQIEWDKWRNKFLYYIQQQCMEFINNPEPGQLRPMRFDPVTNRVLPRFPLGTSAWFQCQVTRDGRIVNLSIQRSSGFQDYDRAVLRAVRALEGTSVLRFPRGSRREIVSQAAGVTTATSNEFRYHKFGDVERYREAP